MGCVCGGGKGGGEPKTDDGLENKRGPFVSVLPSPSLPPPPPHLAQRPFLVDGNDFEHAVVQVQRNHAGGGVDVPQLPRVGGAADAVGRVAAGAGDQLPGGRVPVQHAEVVALGGQEEGVGALVLLGRGGSGGRGFPLLSCVRPRVYPYCLFSLSPAGASGAGWRRGRKWGRRAGPVGWGGRREREGRSMPCVGKPSPRFIPIPPCLSLSLTCSPSAVMRCTSMRVPLLGRGKEGRGEGAGRGVGEKPRRRREGAAPLPPSASLPPLPPHIPLTQ